MKHYYLMGCQLENLKNALKKCRTVNLANLSKNMPEETEKACQSLFWAVNSLNTVISQVEDGQYQQPAGGEG